MKKLKFITVLSIVGMFLLSTSSAFARKDPPNGVNNYISGGHLYVWYNDAYVDMGEYNPG